MSRRAPVASGALLLLLVAGQPCAAQEAGFVAVDLTCSGTADFDLSTGYYVCVGMKLTSSDGRISVSAGQASSEEGVGFDDHTWRLVDGIDLGLEGTRITADSAELVFEDNELVAADIRGSPAELFDFIEERNTDFHASADRLTYDSGTDTLHIPGQASFQMGEERLKGCNLVYNPVRRRLTVSTDDDCTAELRFVPQTRDSEPEASTEVP